MKVERLSAGWRVGVVLGAGMVRVWLFRWIVTLRDSIGPMRAN